MARIAFLAIAVVIPCMASGCAFQFDPAATVTCYRADGWHLPGIADFNSSAPAPVSIRQQTSMEREQSHHLTMKNPTFSSSPPRPSPFDVARKRMRPALVRAVILKWEMNGKIFAYSYDVTFIDKDGDGVFRLLAPGVLTEAHCSGSGETPAVRLG